MKYIYDMGMIHKSYKFKMEPTSSQKVLLAKHFGSCRFLFNYFLHERKEKYLNEKTSLSFYDNSKALTELKTQDGFSWLKEVSSQSLQASIRNLDVAYKKFFNKQNRFPKFKSKNSKQSFKIPQNVFVKEDKLIISKFREGIRIIQHRELEGKILFAVISKTPTGKYFVSITCEVDHISIQKMDGKVGIDTGIKDLAILSNGKRYGNIKVLKTNLKKLKYEQRQLSKKRKGSNSRNKQRKQVASLYVKITNARKDYLHKVSTEIIKNHDVIAVEDLHVKGIMKNRHLAQAMSDVGLGEFYKQLEYKSKWNGRSFVKIDRFFPSSKTCSNCGWINQDLKLSDREWNCLSCKTRHDRDWNASKNILKQGLNILSGSGTESYIKQKQVEASTSVESLRSETHLSLVNE